VLNQNEDLIAQEEEEWDPVIGMREKDRKKQTKKSS